MADFQKDRLTMVREIEGYPSLYKVHDPRVLEAMRKVPRHEFVPREEASAAYEDRPLYIGEGQTISQPFMVAYMTQSLALAPGSRVLEVGAGSGYQAAVLAELAAEVYAVEIVEPLASRARRTLERLGYRGVRVKAADGYEGWPEHAPYDAVLVSCAADHVPEPLVAQLKTGGRIVVPVDRGQGPGQELVLGVKTAAGLETSVLMDVRFVPMTR